MTDPVWEAGAPRALPSAEGDVSADLCVIGLGGSGLAAVLQALADGATVIGLDAGRIGSGAAGRNGGFLLAGTALPHHRAVEVLGREKAARAHRLTLDELARMETATPELVRRVGSLRVALSGQEEDDCAAHLAALGADGFRALGYDGAEGRGILLPDDGAFDPLARCRVLAHRAVAGGAALHEDSPVLSVHAGVVSTAAATVRCRAAVVAVDGGLEDVVPALSPRVRTARLQMLATAPADDVAIPRPVYARWGYDYWQQLPDGRIALGGCRDLDLEAEWGQPAETSLRVQAELERTLRDVIGTAAPVTHRWAGRSAYTADLLPVLEEIEPGVVVAGAYSGHGNVIGSLCGRGAAQLALSGATDLWLDGGHL